jgi:K+-sensing histidine kinase KdpD
MEITVSRYARRADRIRDSTMAPRRQTQTFNRISPRKRMLGLGLAIVKKTVDDMGGTVSIQSTVGEGTTVTLDIPVEQAQP